MKNFILLFLFFFAIIAFAFSGLYERDLLGGTQLNGAGCVCHTIEQDTSVSVWIDGPDTLLRGQTGLYRMYLANGPAEAGGHNVAGRFGTMSVVDTLSVWDSRSPNELTQAFPLEFPTPLDTIYWDFAYTAPDSIVIDTLYSCGLSLVYDHIPDFHDRWNFGPKFPISIVDGIVPVEIISFSASTSENSIILNWNTASETNNAGFELQRLKESEAKGFQKWKSINFIKGNGSTTESKFYSYNDKYLSSGKYQYRLKQYDYNGTFDFSNIVEVEVLNPNCYSLEQNYPNPFNPSTIIKFTVIKDGFVSLKIFNSVGEEVETLLNQFIEAGLHSKIYTTGANSKLSSGVYFYQLKAGDFVSTKKMLLLK